MLITAIVNTNCAAKWLQQIALDYVQAIGGGVETLRAQIQGIVP